MTARAIRMKLLATYSIMNTEDDFPLSSLPSNMPVRVAWISWTM